VRVLLANKYHGRRGGAESVVLQTARLLEEAGHDVVPFAMRDDDSAASEWSEYFVPTRHYFEGSTIRRVGDSLAAIYSLDARRRLRALLRAARPDVAHLHNVYHQLSLSIVDELRSARVPIVMTLHDYKAACPNYHLLTHDGLCQRCVGGAYWNAVRHRCLKGSIAGSAIASIEAYVNRIRKQYGKVDLFLAPSEFLRDVMVRAGLPSDRIEVLRNAVPVAPAPRPLPSRPRFLYFGRLSREKGVDTILDASPEISAEIEIVLFGTGPLLEALRRRVEGEGLAVQLKGFVTREVLDRELRSTTAALLPSQCYENCPMSLLEASALGVPTIASDIGGIPELVTNGVDGILVTPGDETALAAAVNALAATPSLAEALGEAAHGRVSQGHREETYLDALLGHYGRVLGARRARMPS
jgi:glycosyltransferase involved in cell wall biosynthesis